MLPSAPSVLTAPAPMVSASPAQYSAPSRALLHSSPSEAPALRATMLFCSRYMRLAATRRGWRSTQPPTAAPHSTDSAASSSPHRATRAREEGCSSSMISPTANSQPRCPQVDRKCEACGGRAGGGRAGGRGSRWRWAAAVPSGLRRQLLGTLLRPCGCRGRCQQTTTACAGGDCGVPTCRRAVAWAV